MKNGVTCACHRMLTALAVVGLLISASVAATPSMPDGRRPERCAEAPAGSDIGRRVIAPMVVRQPSWQPTAPVVGRVIVTRPGGASMAIVAPDRGDMFGYAACVVDDLDGDGTAEIAAAAPLAALRTGMRGRVYIHSGADGRLIAELASRVNENPLRQFATGLVLVEDVDGDGVRELGVRCEMPNSADRAHPLVDVEVMSLVAARTIEERPDRGELDRAAWSIVAPSPGPDGDGLRAGLRADVNADHMVDSRDLIEVLRAADTGGLQAASSGPQAARRAFWREDVNADDRIDGADISEVLARFGAEGDEILTTTTPDCRPPNGVDPPGSTFGDCYTLCCFGPGGGPGDGPGGDGGCPGDADCDGIGDGQDCDRIGAIFPPCACSDDDGDGCKNQNDCESSCYMGPPSICTCNVHLKPDPSTHQAGATTVYVLPGDEEIVSITGDRPRCEDITITASGPIKILNKDKLVSSIEVSNLVGSVTIVGVGTGTGSLSVTTSDGPCGSVEVKAGGRAVVEYDRAPTYQIDIGSGRYLDQPPPAPNQGVNGPNSQSESPDAWVFGNLPRQRIRDEVHARANTIDPLNCTYRVTLFDADGNRKRGRPVRLAFKDGKILCKSKDSPWLGETQRTNNQGFTDFTLLADPERIAELNEGTLPFFPERSGDTEAVIALIGRAATEPITSDTLDEVGASWPFATHTCSGYSLVFDRNLTCFDPSDRALSGIVAPLVLLNHTQYMVAYHWIVEALWPDPVDFTDQMLALQIDFETGQLELVHVDSGPVRPWQLAPVASQYWVAIAAELDARGISYAPWKPEHDEPEPPAAQQWLRGEFSFATVAADLTLAMLPFGDGLEIFRQLYLRPEYLGEDPSHLVLSIAAMGFAADATYLLGPLGAPVSAPLNLALGILKVSCKYLPRLTTRALLKMEPTLQESVLTLIRYISRTRRVPGSTDLEHGVQVIEKIVNEGRVLERGALHVGEEWMDDTVKLLADRATRDLSRDAFEGTAFAIRYGKSAAIHRLFDEFDVDVVERTLELVRKLELNTTQFSDDAIRGVAVAVESVGPTSPLVREFLEGPLVSGEHAARKALALSNLDKLRERAGLADMVRYLRNNANNAAVDGVVFEGTVARKIVLSEVPQSGALTRVSHDGLPNANTIDTTTATRAIQIKYKSDAGHFTPSEIRNNSLSGADYLDALRAQASALALQPTLITNRPISGPLSDLLAARGIHWIQVAE